MEALKLALLIVCSAALVGVVSYGFAVAGEPQSTWLICDVLGMESACR